MKKIISALLVMVLTLGLLAPLSGCSFDKDVMTRQEWIELLSAEFGLDQYVGQEQAFKDVKPTDDIYVGVQSCVDWGILDNTESKEFKPKDYARVHFAIDTAVAASGVTIDNTTVEKYAREQGIIGKSYSDYNQVLTESKADEIIEWAKDLYLNLEPEYVENVVLNESVKDITNSVSAVQVSETAYSVSGEDAANVKDGDIVILPPSEENPSGLARKIVSVTKNTDGSVTYETVEPAIEELCTDLEIATIAVPEKEDVVLADGVKWSSGDIGLNDSDGVELISLVSTGNDAKVVNTASKGLGFTVDVNFTKGKMKLSNDWAGLFKTSVDDTGMVSASKDFNSLFGMGEKVTVGGERGFSAQSGLDDTSKLGELFNKTSIIPDRKLFGKDPYDNTAAIEAYKAGEISLDELKDKLNVTKDQQEKKVASMTNKFAGSYEITGKLSVKNLYVTPVLKMKKVFGVPTGIKELTVTVNYDIESSLSIKGKITEELTVCNVNVPVGGTGVTVNVKLILFADFNGELTVRAEIGNNTKLEYNDGKFKKTASKTSSLSASLSAQIDFGPGLKVDIKFLGVNIVDTKVTAAVRLKFNAGAALKTSYTLDEDAINISRSTEYTLKFSAYVPIVKLSIGQSKSLANKLKLSFSWEIIGEKSAKKFELGEENVVLWKEEQTIKLREEEEEENAEDAFDPSDYLKLDSYFVNMDENDTRTIEIANLPEGYSNSDLIWNTEDSGIAVINNGTITAKGYGATVGSVTTADGIYTCYIAIRVGSEIVDFTPLEDGLVYDI